MPLPTSSTPFVAEMRRQADLGIIWKAIKWGGLAALVAIWGFWIILRPDPGAEADSQLVGIGLLIAGIVGLFFVVRTAIRRVVSGTHPLDKELAAFGDPAAVGRDIEAAFGARAFAPRRVQIAGPWLCYVGKGLTIVRRLDRLVWAYRLRISHRLNGIIPYRFSHDLMLWSRDGSGTAIPGPKARLDESLQTLHAAVPWLLMGYNDVIKESWNSDRSELIALVDARRRATAGPGS